MLNGLIGIRQNSFGSWWMDSTGTITTADHWGLSFVPFAFHDYGMVKLSADPFGLEMRWNVHSVDEQTQDRALDWILASQDGIRLRLTYYYFGWYTEYVSKETVQQKVLATRAFKDVDLGQSVSMARDDAANASRDFNLLNTSLQAWNDASRDFDRSALQSLQGDLVIFRRDEDTGAFRYGHIGRNASISRFMGRNWAQSVVSSDNQPQDNASAYRAITNSSYHAVMSNGEPRYDRILASIEAPGHEPTWSSYHRLLLPSRDQRGAPIMICASQISDFNFPLLANGGPADAYHPSSSMQASGD
jgi:hypothetical protein